MTKVARRILIVVALVACLIINGYGISKRTIIIKTEIQNGSSLDAYNLDFENGGTRLLLIPIERFQELEFMTFTSPGTNERMYLPATDIDEFVSIPLAEKIDVELSDIKLGTYLLVVSGYRISDDEGIDIGPMLLTIESNGVQGAYAIDVTEKGDQLIFNPVRSYLAILH